MIQKTSDPSGGPASEMRVEAMLQLLHVQNQTLLAALEAFAPGRIEGHTVREWYLAHLGPTLRSILADIQAREPEAAAALRRTIRTMLGSIP